MEDSVKHGLFINATVGVRTYALKAVSLNSPKTSLDTLDGVQLTGRIYGGV